MSFNYPDNIPIMPSNETVANSDVDGNRKGLILPFIAITALKTDNVAVTTVKKITSSGRSGFSATYAYAPAIVNVNTVVTCQV